MAPTKALLLTIALASTSSIAQGSGSCNTILNGQCNFIDCYAWRGATSCVGDFGSKVCVCDPGYCASPDQATCVPEPLSNVFKVGDAVNARDSKKDSWIPGKVLFLKPDFEVQPDGFSKAFTWVHVELAPPKFKLGDAVESKDTVDEWKRGSVTSVSPLRVQPTGWEVSFAFAHVRQQNWQELQAAAAKNLETAKAQLRAASEETLSAAKTMKQRADAAVLTATTKAQDATLKQKASDDEAAKLKALLEIAAKTKQEQEDQDQFARDAASKKLGSEGALREASELAASTAAKAKSKAAASANAQKDLLQRKADLAVQVKQEGDEASVAEASKKQADAARKAGQDALADAMEAAWKETLVAQKQTSLLVRALQKKVSLAEQVSADMDTAFLKSKKAADDAKAGALAAAHNQVSQATEAAQEAHKAALAKEAADKAAAAGQQAMQMASARAEEARQAAAAQKTAKSVAQQAAQEAAYRMNEAQVAEAKAREAEEHWPLKPQVDLYEEEPAAPFQGNVAVMAFAGLGAAVMVTVAMSRQRTHVRGSVVMPESILG